MDDQKRQRVIRNTAYPPSGKPQWRISGESVANQWRVSGVSLDID
ncbi:MAG: hypothetical protein ACO391_04340 [Pseudomonadales bacterium]